MTASLKAPTPCAHRKKRRRSKGSYLGVFPAFALRLVELEFARTFHVDVPAAAGGAVFLQEAAVQADVALGSALQKHLVHTHAHRVRRVGIADLDVIAGTEAVARARVSIYC